MEPVVNKLQEGVKYPRFERDATKTINDLVEHITKERGIYSSSIEPNPSEHNIWFNTDTNTLMIYNNHAWRYFSGSSSSNGWNVENALIYRDENNYLIMSNIKDKTFYILNFDATSDDSINIPNLSDDIEFYIFFPKIPTEIHFHNSNIITNYNVIAKSFDRTSLAGMAVLMHKIGITVEFNVIDDKTYTSNVDYIYNTKLTEVYMVSGRAEYHTVERINNNNNNGINQIEIKLPSNIPTSDYTIGSFTTNGDVQIVYPPFKYEISAKYTSSICIFKNPNSKNELKVLSSINNTDNVCQESERSSFPAIAIFDRFNPDNIDTICTTYYADFLDDDNCGLIIKDNWYFETFNQNSVYSAGLSIIIDDFPINKNNDFFNTNSVYYCNSLVINNSSDDDRIKSLIERIVCDDFEFTNYEQYEFDLPDHSLIYTTNYKSKYIGIPHNKPLYSKNLLIFIANKLRDNTEIIVDYATDIHDLGEINIITIPENVNILENLIDTNRNNNVTIYGTLTVDSIYDDKGLLAETYQYSIDNINHEYTYDRYDTPVIA